MRSRQRDQIKRALRASRISCSFFDVLAIRTRSRNSKWEQICWGGRGVSTRESAKTHRGTRLGKHLERQLEQQLAAETRRREFARSRRLGRGGVGLVRRGLLFRVALVGTVIDGPLDGVPVVGVFLHCVRLAILLRLDRQRRLVPFRLLPLRSTCVRAIEVEGSAATRSTARHTGSHDSRAPYVSPALFAPAFFLFFASGAAALRALRSASTSSPSLRPHGAMPSSPSLSSSL
jgi:hypothetical protein